MLKRPHDYLKSESKITIISAFDWKIFKISQMELDFFLMNCVQRIHFPKKMCSVLIFQQIHIKVHFILY